MRRCTMAETLTEKQRVAVETLEGGRRAGVPLSDYTKAKGLATRPVYDAIAALRRRGALPGTDRPRKRKSKFVAVRGTSSRTPLSEVGPAARSGMVCRLGCEHGGVIEGGEGPPPGWLSGGAPRPRGAAPRPGALQRLAATRRRHG